MSKGKVNRHGSLHSCECWLLVMFLLRFVLSKKICSSADLFWSQRYNLDPDL